MDIEREKRRIVVDKVLYGLIPFVLIMPLIVLVAIGCSDMIGLLVGFEVVLIILLVLCITLMVIQFSYKEYELNGKTVFVYCGAYSHYIAVDGEKYDEHNTVLSFTPITLNCTVDDINVECVISLTGRISVKANGKLLTNKAVK